MGAPTDAAGSRRTSVAGMPGALYWLALGTFAIGTEGFMIAALLVPIATDLRVSIVQAGLLVSIFAFAYATSSPVLTVLTGRLDRRRLLISSMSLFAFLNIGAAMAHSFLALAAARVLLAFAAGLYTPNANALAGAVVSPEHRGRAIAIVNGGLTMAIALGVPLGAFVGDRLGWRMTFVGVGVLSAIASAGLSQGLRHGVGATLVSASLADRIRTVRNPCVARTLAVTTVWASGSYAVYTYLAPLLYDTTLLRGAQIGLALSTWGLAAGLGLFVSGAATDRLGTEVVRRASLTGVVVALAGLAVVANAVTPTRALVPVLAAIALWGMCSFGVLPGWVPRKPCIPCKRLSTPTMRINAATARRVRSSGSWDRSAVDHVFGARDGTRSRRCHERDEICDLPRLGRSSKGNAPERPHDDLLAAVIVGARVSCQPLG